MNELYEMIRDIPGIIVELGVHFGQNFSLFEKIFVRSTSHSTRTGGLSGSTLSQGMHLRRPMNETTPLSAGRGIRSARLSRIPRSNPGVS